MSLAERLGGPQPAPSSDCSVCRWLSRADDADRQAFAAWLDDDGNVSSLWRACAADPVNPLQIKRPRFAELINDHHRGGACDVA